MEILLTIISVVSGVIATSLFYLLVKKVQALKKSIVNAEIMKVYNMSHIDDIFDNQSIAKDDMFENGKNSKILYVFATQGATISDPAHKEIYSLLSDASRDIRFLVFHPDSKSANERQEELKDKIGNLRVKITGSIAELIDHNNGKIKIKLHNENLRFRLYIFDDVMYIGFKLLGEYSTDLQVWKVSKDSLLYKSFFEHFSDNFDMIYYNIFTCKSQAFLGNFPQNFYLHPNIAKNSRQNPEYCARTYKSEKV